ncbi:hypothetical protein DFH09DRAFT_54413, partial [Mycena vulgaris]
MSFIIIDDRDPTVTYKGTWVVGGTTHEHSGTVSSSVAAGDSFTVPFTGTGITVYGTFDSSSAGVKTSYAIDGGSATTVTSPSSGKDSFQQLFWQSDAVPSASHNLVVTMVSVNNVGDGEGTIWFDYFNVTSAAFVPSSSAPTSLSTANASKNTATTTSASPASTSSAAIVPVKKSSHTAIIAAVVVVVVVVLIGICAAVMFRRRRRQQDLYKNFQPSTNMSSTLMGGPPPTQPFLPNQTPMTPMSGFAGSAPVLAAKYAAPAGAPYGHPGQAYAPMPPHAPSPQGAYDPYAAPQAGYAASVSSAPSSSQPSSSQPTRGVLSVV